MKRDVVVIGSGVSGMSAALILAKLGRQVTIIEQNGYPAPLLRRFAAGNGAQRVMCDPGLHYSGGFFAPDTPGANDEPLAVMFRYLGVMERIQTTPMDPEGFDILHWHGGGEEGLAIPYGMERLQDALCRRFPKSRQAVEGYVRRISDIYGATPLTSFNSATKLSGRKTDEEESLEEFLTAAGAEEELRLLLDEYGHFLSGAHACELPMRVHALVSGSLFHSACSFPRGGDELTEAFAERLTEQGVELLCGQTVTALNADDGRRLTGVTLESRGEASQELLECETCICTIHPRRLIELLPRHSVRPAYFSRLRDLPNTFAPFAVFLDADETPAILLRSNILLFKPQEPAAVAAAEGEPFTVGSTSIMNCGPATNDESEQRKALSVICELRPTPGDGSYGRELRQSPEQYREFKERMTEEAVQEMLRALPELKGKCRVVAAASPCTYERYTGTVGGAIYGLRQTTRQQSLGPRVGVQGLYLAGQSIGAPGMMGAVVSAFVAAAAIVGWDVILAGVQDCR
jgi:all-trans-retinol 13,14-reductase